jgi:excinuclease ABC subunit A
LRIEARFVKVGKGSQERAIYEVAATPLRETLRFFETLKLTGAKREISDRIVKEIVSRLRFLNNVGLDYLSLDRSADTLSGGEAQRIRLASQIGSGLTGVMYVLDEPSIGLHQRDNDRLITTLKHLRDIGNSVLVVEHDEDAIRCADFVVDMGLGAGVHGGEIIAQGTLADILKNKKSLTAQYLNGAKKILVPKKRIASNPERQFVIAGASGNNLKHVRLELPVGLLTCVTGVSGSGKSTLVNDTLYHAAARHLYGSQAEPAAHDSISGLEHFDKVISVDQAPIGRTPRSNPATYTGLFTPIRDLFSATRPGASRSTSRAAAARLARATA